MNFKALMIDVLVVIVALIIYAKLAKHFPVIA